MEASLSLRRKEAEKILSNINRQEWRLNNLYHIKDAYGKKVLFHMNAAQQYLYYNLWFLDIILKARQLGFTTIIDLLLLDIAIFHPNTHCGIIAHHKDDAIRFFEEKVLFPYRNLPELVRKAVHPVTDSKRELLFSNGSRIYVGTSLRSGTVQYLHVSEFGVACSKYPDKANEIVTGAFNTVHPGNIIIIESTAKGRGGQFYDMCRKAMNQQKEGRSLTKLDYKFFFFPWWKHPGYFLDEEVEIPEEMQEYFLGLEQQHGIYLFPQQQAWYVKKAESQGDNMKQEYPSHPEEAFEATTEGRYYAKLLNKARLQGRIKKGVYDPNLLVHTFWDLGIGDAMSIWFAQFDSFGPRVVDYYEFNDTGLRHYIRILHNKTQEFGYEYGEHWAPHDIKARDPMTGKTRRKTAGEMGIRFRTCKRMPLDDGIEEMRQFLEVAYFEIGRTDKGVKNLEDYAKEWNEKYATYLDRPASQWCNHGADAGRTMAYAWKHHFKAGGRMSAEDLQKEWETHAPPAPGT